MSEEKEPKSHVSFTEITNAHECKYRHHLIYNLNNKQPSTIHTVFGNAVHDSIDRYMKGATENTWISAGKNIYKWVKQNPVHSYKNAAGEIVEQELNPADWVRQAFVIYDQIFDWLDKTFPNSKLIGSEIRLKESIEEIDTLKFKGFIDLLLLDEKGVYHVIDFKTCSWGWDKYKRSDTKKQYQISLYKKFVCEKLGIDPKNAKTHFVLLKRTPPKDKPAVELITVTSGPKKLSNANAWMVKNAKGIKRGLRIKNRTTCKYCPFLHTQLCP